MQHNHKSAIWITLKGKEVGHNTKEYFEFRNPFRMRSMLRFKEKNPEYDKCIHLR